MRESVREKSQLSLSDHALSILRDAVVLDRVLCRVVCFYRGGAVLYWCRVSTGGTSAAPVVF